jgi:OmpA-OmpF porin, OOP family
MMKRGIFFLFFVMIVFFASHCPAQDVEGSRDHPMFNRLSGFHITEYAAEDFGGHTFYDENDREVEVAGKKTFIKYECDGQVGALKIIRNFSNAMKKIGGQALEQSGNRVYLNIKQGNRETWAEIFAGENDYDLTIVEKGEVEQEITASTILKELNSTGKAILHINFDAGQSTIKKESLPIVDQIVEMMRQVPDMRLSVEGHTDGDGSNEANQKLSEQRARAVVDVIVKGRIDRVRLTFAGFGEEKPIADNSTEEGKARNRRVELIKR